MINQWIKRYPQLKAVEDKIWDATNALIDCYKSGAKVLICGNGGSCSDSGHITGELMKGFKSLRPISDETKQKYAELFGEEGAYLASVLQGSLPTISLPDQTAVLTAFNNDVDAAAGYAQLVFGYARQNDVLICLSTSGNSKNVVNAAMAARVAGIKVISLTSQKECKLDTLSDIIIHVPESQTAYVQELHLPVYHAICAQVEKEMFGE